MAKTKLSRNCLQVLATIYELCRATEETTSRELAAKFTLSAKSIWKHKKRLREMGIIEESGQCRMGLDVGRHGGGTKRITVNNEKAYAAVMRSDPGLAEKIFGLPRGSLGDLGITLSRLGITPEEWNELSGVLSNLRASLLKSKLEGDPGKLGFSGLVLPSGEALSSLSLPLLIQWITKVYKSLFSSLDSLKSTWDYLPAGAKESLSRVLEMEPPPAIPTAFTRLRTPARRELGLTPSLEPATFGEEPVKPKRWTLVTGEVDSDLVPDLARTEREKLRVYAELTGMTPARYLEEEMRAKRNMYPGYATMPFGRRTKEFFYDWEARVRRIHSHMTLRPKGGKLEKIKDWRHFIKGRLQADQEGARYDDWMDGLFEWHREWNAKMGYPRPNQLHSDPKREAGAKKHYEEWYATKYANQVRDRGTPWFLPAEYKPDDPLQTEYYDWMMADVRQVAETEAKLCRNTIEDLIFQTVADLVLTKTMSLVYLKKHHSELAVKMQRYLEEVKKVV
jgi:hypothetical protein